VLWQNYYKKKNNDDDNRQRRLFEFNSIDLI